MQIEGGTEKKKVALNLESEEKTGKRKKTKDI